MSTVDNKKKIKMPRKEKNILHDLAQMPWWISVCVAGVVYLSLRYIFPSIEFESQAFKSLATMSPGMAWISIIFLFPAVLSAAEAFRKRKLLDRQKGIDSIRSLTWKEFEELLAEAYRRQGYIVRENESTGPDGGVDVVLEKGGNLFLVQCKHWKSNKVGVKEVRELFGVMAKRKATGGIVIASGMFTQEAQSFAAGEAIDLVGGNQLVEMIQSVQARSSVVDESVEKEDSNVCPDCGKTLVIREAKRGKTKGRKFWGCTGYPKCRFTKSYS